MIMIWFDFSIMSSEYLVGKLTFPRRWCLWVKSTQHWMRTLQNETDCASKFVGLDMIWWFFSRTEAVSQTRCLWTFTFTEFQHKKIAKALPTSVGSVSNLQFAYLWSHKLAMCTIPNFFFPLFDLTSLCGSKMLFLSSAVSCSNELLLVRIRLPHFEVRQFDWIWS